MKTIINIITFFIVIILITACTGKKVSENELIEAPQSYFIALDLSDRIDDPVTVEKDIATIKQVFDFFEKKVMHARYIKSQDKFSVVLIPQSRQCNTQELNNMIGEMSIDMNNIPVRKRYECFLNFKQRFENNLRNVYKLAQQPTLKEYYGCNIWKFLSDQLPDMMDGCNGMDVKLVLLTDCYIEIDNKNEIFERNGQTNHMNNNIMARLRKNDYWQQHSCNVLLIPERLSNRDLSRLNMVVVGLTPHNSYPYEVQLLEKVWGDFFQRISLSYRIISYINGISVVSQNLYDALI